MGNRLLRIVYGLLTLPLEAIYEIAVLFSESFDKFKDTPIQRKH